MIPHDDAIGGNGVVEPEADALLAEAVRRGLGKRLGQGIDRKAGAPRRMLAGVDDFVLAQHVEIGEVLAQRRGRRRLEPDEIAATIALDCGEDLVVLRVIEHRQGSRAHRYLGADARGPRLSQPRQQRDQQRRQREDDQIDPERVEVAQDPRRYHHGDCRIGPAAIDPPVRPAHALVEARRRQLFPAMVQAGLVAAIVHLAGDGVARQHEAHPAFTPRLSLSEFRRPRRAHGHPRAVACQQAVSTGLGRSGTVGATRRGSVSQCDPERKPRLHARMAGPLPADLC